MKLKQKTVILICLCAAFILCLAGAIAVSGAEGDLGTSTNPILIGTAAELKAFSERVYNGETALCAKLTANISLNDETFTFEPDTGLVRVADAEGHVAYYGTGIKGDGSGDSTKFDSTASNAGKWYNAEGNSSGANGISMSAWVPIGNSASSPYTGTFDGDGHTVSGLAYTMSGNFGLFGYNGGIIKNIGIINSYIYFSSSSNIGGVCAYNTGSITNCYTTGIAINAGDVGGICGENGSGGTISDCYNIGIVSGSAAKAICGKNAGTITNCYYLDTSCANAGGGTPKTAADFSSGEVTYLLNGSRSEGTTENPLVWYQTCGTGYPAFSGQTVYNTYTDCDATVKGYANRLHPEPGHSYNDDGFCIYCDGYQPAREIDLDYDFDGDGNIDNLDSAYEITNAGNLYWLAARVNNFGDIGFNTVLTKNIVLNPGTFDTSGNYTPADGETVRTWTPIGTSEDRGYTGIFDGGGHTVSGIYINGTSDNIGMFGVNYGTIKNLGVINGYISGGGKIGGICGYNFIGSIINCKNAVTVKGTYDSIGGVAGMNSGTVTNCYNTGSVSGTNEVGGVYGHRSGSSIITNCYYLGTAETDELTGTTFKTSSEFASGEVAWLLNGGKTDGTQAFYQTCGTGLPAFSGSTVYRYEYLKCDNTSKSPAVYSYANVSTANVVDAHDFNSDGFCTACGAYQPAIEIDLDYDFNGDGDIDDWDRAYEISNAGNLYWFAELINYSGSRGYNAVLTKNIVLNPGTFNASGAYTPANGETVREWTPIGTSEYDHYFGIFDGKGHAVSGIYINGESVEIGMFGASAGTIRNLSVINGYISGGKRIGGICGYNFGGSIINCKNAVTVKGTYDSIGGVVGHNSGIVTNCYNTGSVSGAVDVGSVCGHRGSGSIITNCYYLGTEETDELTGTTFKTALQFASGEVAWLLNRDSDGNQLTPSVWYQTLSGDDKDAFPTLDSTHGTVYEGYIYDANGFGTAGYTNTEGATGQYQPAVRIVGGNYTDFGFTAANWEAYENYYAITNAGNLYWFSEQVNTGNTSYNAVLTANIAINDETFTFDPDTGLVRVTDTENHIAYLGTGIAGDASGGNTIFDTEASTAGKWYTSDSSTDNTDYGGSLRIWTPIGSLEKQYNGTFDGNGKTFSGMYIKYIDNYALTEQGLFGCVDTGGNILNTGVVSGFLHGYMRLGGVCGYNKGTISGCYNSVTVTVTIKAGSDNTSIGGVCGELSGGTVENCYNTGAVRGGYNVGGICGRSAENNNNDSMIKGCYNTGTVSCGTSTFGSSNAGGVCGGNSGVIEESYNTGAVTASGYYVGGICGNNSNSVTECYNLGSVHGGTDNKGVVAGTGGVCGRNDDDATVASCYNAGTVTGRRRIGSVCGYDGSSSIIINCYYLGTSETDELTGTTFKTALQFASGEVAWLLNGGKTDGTQAFYQTCGTGYPAFSGNVVYFDASADPQYYNESVVSVAVTWGAMEFTYSGGTWNPETHTYIGAGWTADDENGNRVTVKNEGTVSVTFTLVYVQSTSYTGISGTFGDGVINTVVDNIALPAGETKRYYLILSGVPEQSINGATLGRVTVRLGGS